MFIQLFTLKQLFFVLVRGKVISFDEDVTIEMVTVHVSMVGFY